MGGLVVAGDGCSGGVVWFVYAYTVTTDLVVYLDTCCFSFNRFHCFMFTRSCLSTFNQGNAALTGSIDPSVLIVALLGTVYTL